MNYNKILWYLYQLSITISGINAMFYVLCFEPNHYTPVIGLFWIGWMSFIGLRECWVRRVLGV